MKKILLAVSLMIFPHYPVNVPIIPKTHNIEHKQPQIPEQNSSFDTFSDEGLTTNEINFSPGQIVYLKAEVESPNAQNAIFTLSDQDKNNLMTRDMEKKDGYFTAQLTAPGTEGIYYVRIEIAGEGLSFIGEKNINVGNTGGSVTAETNIENVVKGESTHINDQNDDSAKPTPFPENEDMKISDKSNLAITLKNQIIIIINAIRNFFSFSR